MGEFKKGNRDGNGTITLASGSKYVGEFKNNNKNGNGTYTWAVTTNRLVNYFVDEFNKKTDTDMTSNERAMRRLRTACERLNQTACERLNPSDLYLEIDTLYDGHDFQSSITTKKWEEITTGVVPVS